MSLTLVDNGVPVYGEAFPADALSIPVDVTLAPLDEGPNAIAATVEYRGAVAGAALPVLIPDGVLDLSVTPPATPDELAIDVTGTVTLGWDSDAPATVEVRIDGVVVGTTELPGVAGPADFDLPIALPHGGANLVVVDATYGESRRETSFVVGVGEPLLGFAYTLATAVTPTFDVALSGQVDLGYRSDRPATLEISADGVVVDREVLDASGSTAIPIAAVVPLSHVGESTIVGRVVYEGAEASATASVSVDPEAPTVTLPTWSVDFVPSVSLTASGLVDAVPGAGWTVDAVRGSMDGGLTWTDATPSESGWRQAFVDPDLQQPVVVEVTTVNRGIPVTWRYDDVLPVAAIFDCADPGSMVPSPDLYQSMRTEYRTMVGYFGSPTGPHTVGFAITADTEFANNVTELAAPLQRGRFAIDVSIGVDQFRCGGTCSQPYDLTALVDGVTLCSKSAFGDISETNGG